MLELFLPIDEKRHNSFINHHTDTMISQTDVKSWHAKMNFLKKNHTNLWPITINSNLNPNKKIKNNEYKCASCQKYAYLLDAWFYYL